MTTWAQERNPEDQFQEDFSINQAYEYKHRERKRIKGHRRTQA